MGWPGVSAAVATLSILLLLPGHGRAQQQPGQEQLLPQAPWKMLSCAVLRGWSQTVFTHFPLCSSQYICGFTSCWKWTFQKRSTVRKQKYPAQVTHPAQENVSEIFQRSSPCAGSALGVAGVRLGHLARSGHPPAPPGNLAHPSAMHTELHSLQPGMQLTIKNKALLFRGFPPNPNKMTPNLPVCSRVEFSFRFW